MIQKVLDFFKSWSKVFVGLLAVVFFFIVMKKLGLSLGGLLSMVRGFISPKPTSGDPAVATQVSETVKTEEVKIEQTQAQSVSEKTIAGIDEILSEMDKRK
jgi:hypothetical protein